MKKYTAESVENLIACAKAVLKNWPGRGLATAVRELDAALKELADDPIKTERPRTDGNTRRYRIVNTFDRPCEELIAELREDGKLYYANPNFAGRNSFSGMSAEESVPVEDFGVRLDIAGDGKLTGKLIRSSSAMHPDGRPRHWQGASSFGFYPVRSELDR